MHPSLPGLALCRRFTDAIDAGRPPAPEDVEGLAAALKRFQRNDSFEKALDLPPNWRAASRPDRRAPHIVAACAGRSGSVPAIAKSLYSQLTSYRARAQYKTDLSAGYATADRIHLFAIIEENDGNVPCERIIRGALYADRDALDQAAELSVPEGREDDASELIANIELTCWCERHRRDPEARFLRPKLTSWPAIPSKPSEAAYGIEAREASPTAQEFDQADEFEEFFSRHLRDHRKGQKVLRLFYGEDLSIDVVARIMRLSKGKVADLHNVALKGLLSGMP